MKSRTVWNSTRHGSLVLEEDGQRKLYQLDEPASVNALFLAYGFPAQGHITSGLQIQETRIGPVVLLHRSYQQWLPGLAQPQKLIRCCQLFPDQDSSAPCTLTPAEFQRKFGLRIE